MYTPIGHIRANRPGLLMGTLAVVFLLPIIALAMLSIWFVDAKQIAQTEAARAQEHRLAQDRGAQLGRVVDMFLSDTTEVALAAYRAGGAQAARNFYLSDGRLQLVLIYDAQDALLFPERQELPLFAEELYLRQSELRLTEARSRARRNGSGWSGSLREYAPSMIGCHTHARLVVCVLVPPNTLFELAEGYSVVDLNTMRAPVRAPEQVVAILPAPFTGFAIARVFRPETGRSWFAVALLLAPTLLGTGAAIAFLTRAQRTHSRAVRHRIETLSAISHELRTPLSNLRLYSDMLGQPNRRPADLRRYAQVIDEETKRLSGIVDNALLATQNRDGACALENTVPDQRVRALLDRFAPSVSDHLNLQLDLGAPDDIRFDTRCFEQGLLNLLDNARKYAPGGEVTLKTATRPGWLDLHISDDGARADHPAPGPGGLGLGLQVCRNMAEQAGGRFDYAIAKTGSWFHLSLPIRPFPEPALGGQPCVS